MTRVHTSSSTRVKLSTHLRSQYKGIKFDASAVIPLIEAFTKHNVAVDHEALRKLMESKPDLQAVKEFASIAVKSAVDLSVEVRTGLEAMITDLKGSQAGIKSDDESSASLRSQNVFIEDIHTFKAGLIPSKAASPLEPIKSVAKL